MAEGAEARSGGLLGRIERAGNALPDPASLFVIGALAVMALSELAVRADWSIEKSVTRDGARLTETVEPRSLLSADGLFWALDHMVENFIEFPPLGVVLVGMLGIGVAERSGFIAALLKTLMLAVPSSLLTPTLVFVGVLSSLGLDAGYVVLPPVAAALYQAAGRSPLVGLGAVFAGVSAGFSANLVVTSLDPLLAEFSTASARLVDPDYQVAATANLWFMIVSTFLLTGVGWAVTSIWVEPRYAGASPAEGGPSSADSDALEQERLTPVERQGLRVAIAALGATFALFALAIWIPGAPLHAPAGSAPRWIPVIVPLLFIGFLVPGLAYGLRTGSIANDRDVARMMGETMSGMGSYIVLAFFAGQFIAYFRYTGLGEMAAIAGGSRLAQADLPAAVLMLAFIGVVGVGNLFIGSMSAKYAFFAPVFVPMFMQAGVSPELTQVAYRVGDSITNVITPLNPYLVIILVFMRRYATASGLGTLLALMVPYAIAFGVTWSILMVVWLQLGVPLGPAGPLVYVPGS